ncbi:Uncharacterised protein [Vibrio cholerae]|nr:Uncharacterised protein [Vibrio cholerae]
MNRMAHSISPNSKPRSNRMMHILPAPNCSAWKTPSMVKCFHSVIWRRRASLLINMVCNCTLMGLGSTTRRSHWMWMSKRSRNILIRSPCVYPKA